MKDTTETDEVSSPEAAASETSPTEPSIKEEGSGSTRPFSATTAAGDSPTQTKARGVSVQPEVDEKVSVVAKSSDPAVLESVHLDSIPMLAGDDKPSASPVAGTAPTQVSPPPGDQESTPTSTMKTTPDDSSHGRKASSEGLEESTSDQSSKPMGVDENSSSPNEAVAMEIDTQFTDAPSKSETTGRMDVSSGELREGVIAELAQTVQTVEEGSATHASNPATIRRKRKAPAEDTTLGEVFEVVKRKVKRFKKNKGTIKIELTTSVVASTEKAWPMHTRLPEGIATSTTADRILNFNEESWFDESHDGGDEALAFYEETHEEQDPAYLEYMKQKKKSDLRKEMDKLNRRDREGKKEIEDLISQLSREKRESTDKSHQIYREKVSEEERKEQTLLHQNFTERQNAENLKIQRGQKMLQARQQKDVDIAVHQHNQQQGMTEEQRQITWQKTTMTLQSKHERQRQEFSKKSEELKRKTAKEYNMESQKIARKYAKKKTEVDGRRDKFVSQQLEQFSQLKQRYLKRHLHKFVAEKESLLKRMPESRQTHEVAHSRKDASSSRQSRRASEKEDHQPPPPVRSVPDWVRDHEIENADSVVRQKHRKGVLSQAVRHVSIEIHNEGIWTLSVRKADDDGATETVEKEFIQWGPRAFQTLGAIVSGEVPSFYSKLDLSHSPASQGGQIRCSITDLRTSPEVAMAHRAEAYKEQEKLQPSILEIQSKELSKAVLDTEKALKKAEAEENQAASVLEETVEKSERSKAELEQFKTKFGSFLDADGNPFDTMTTLPQRQELTKTIMQFKSKINTAANKASRAHQLLTERKNRTQRLSIALKTAQKDALSAAEALRQRKTKLLQNMPSQITSPSSKGSHQNLDSFDFMVAEVVASFAMVADRRRESLNKKKSGTFSKTWSDAFPELSDSMKKTLWHRMVRRKQQAILRPSHETLLNNMLTRVEEYHLSQSRGSRIVEEEMQKAEQLFLLACFPAPPELPLPVPTPNGLWAEPGSTLDLSVPRSSTQSILPCSPNFPVLNKALGDYASAPGRQAAAVLGTSSFRSMMGPLTALSKASSLAEDQTVLYATAPRVEGDPLDISNDALKKLYHFSLKVAQARAQNLRKKEEARESRTAMKSMKSSDSSVDSTIERPQKRRRSAKNPENSPKNKKIVSSNEANASTSATAAASKPSHNPPLSSPTSRSRKKQPSKQTDSKSQSGQPAPMPSQQRRVDHRLPQVSAHQNQMQQGALPIPNKQEMQVQQRQQQLQQQRQQQQLTAPNMQMQPQRQALQSNQQTRQTMQRTPSNMQLQTQSQALQANQQARQTMQRTASNMQMQQQSQSHHANQQNQQQQQMAQFRMMHPGLSGRQMPPGFPQNMQMQQFYPPMGHPGQGQQRGGFQPGLSPMQMQQRGMPMPFPGIGMPGQSPPQQQQQQQQTQHHHHHPQQQQQQHAPTPNAVPPQNNAGPPQPHGQPPHRGQ